MLAWFVATVVLDCVIAGVTLKYDLLTIGWTFFAALVAAGIAVAAVLGLLGRRTSVAGKMGLLVGSFIAPFVAMGGLLFLFWQMTVTEPPVVLRGMDNTRYHDPDAVEAALHKRFPAGTSEAALATELSAEGFEIDRGRRVATYEWSTDIICSHHLDVHWSVSPGAVLTDIGGAVSSACFPG